MGRRRKNGQPVHGWLNIDKAEGIGSTNVVAIVRRLLNANKVGHAGTLDPMATGILPIALGEATKTISYMQDARKIYKFTIKWGEATDTDDAEGDVISTSDSRPSIQEIEAILSKFTGIIEQVPPKFSAIKIDGKRAYDLARAGEKIEMKSRQIEVFDLQCLSNNQEQAEFEVRCGKGTYIRSLARDMAEVLGTVGHVTVLRRCSVGNFSAETAITLAQLEEMVHSQPLEEFLLPVVTALDDIPALPLTVEEAVKLSNGQIVRFLSLQDRERLANNNILLGQYTGPVLALVNDKALAITELKGASLKPLRVFNF